MAYLKRINHLLSERQADHQFCPSEAGVRRNGMS